MRGERGQLGRRALNQGGNVMEGVAWVLGMGEEARAGGSAWFGKSYFLQFGWYTSVL